MLYFTPCVHNISKGIYVFYGWLSNLDLWWPWTESWMYQFLVTFWLNIQGHSGTFKMCENIVFCNFVHNILKSISPLAFKLGYMMIIDRISDVSNCGDLDSIFKVTAGLNVWTYSILHIVSMIFPKCFFEWVSNLEVHYHGDLLLHLVSMIL